MSHYLVRVKSLVTIMTSQHPMLRHYDVTPLLHFPQRDPLSMNLFRLTFISKIQWRKFLYLGQYYVMLPNSGADRLTQIAQIPGRNGQLLYGNNDGMVLNPNSRNQLGNRLQTVSPIVSIKSSIGKVIDDLHTFETYQKSTYHLPNNFLTYQLTKCSMKHIAHICTTQNTVPYFSLL